MFDDFLNKRKLNIELAAPEGYFESVEEAEKYSESISAFSEDEYDIMEE